MSFADSPHQEADTHGIDTERPHTDEQFDHVMCFGTFDILHPGHLYYLGEAQKFARKMTVVIARDHRVVSGKGRHPVHHEYDRLHHVQESFPAAYVILGDERDIFAPIRDLCPDLLAFGYDQKVPESHIRELFPDITIVRIGGHETDKWKSSLLRQSHSHSHSHSKSA